MFGWPVLGLDQDLPGLAGFGHAPFRWGRWGVLDELGHHRDLVFGQGIGRAPVRHASGRAVGDQRLQVGLAARLGDVGCQRLAGGAFAKHAVATGAALEVDFLGRVEVGLAQVGRAFGLDHTGLFRRSGLVGEGVGGGQRCTQRRDPQGPRFFVADQHSISPQA
ncbi:hypothetical protein D3C76_1110440 [compost metagenome]